MFDLSKYNYNLPKELIAQNPSDPRDSSRLFVYDTEKDEIIFDTFINIDKYLPKSSLLVFNNTKVLPARVILKKEVEKCGWRGGGKVEILLLINELLDGETIIKGLPDSRVWIGQKIFFPDGNYMEVVEQDEKFFFFKVHFDMKMLPDLLFKYGVTPIPKYIGETGMNEDDLREKYQTIFAEKPASVAAPTASLHFTKRVLENIEKRAINSAFITLNVGMGTFAPISEKNFTEGRLHEEYCEIEEDELNKIRGNKDIVAVGTTALRTIEAFADDILINNKQRLSKKTDIFIYPPYNFKIAKHLITNFHLPGSSLMCLVDAFLQHKGAKKNLVELYEIAKKEKFRFYSFGDAMIII